MCDYCRKEMYKEASTPEGRLAFRIERFIDELRGNPMGLYKRGSVADALEGILMCDLEEREHELDVRAELQEFMKRGMLNDEDVEEAIMHDKAERDEDGCER